jgi:hypothetical protein
VTALKLPVEVPPLTEKATAAPPAVKKFPAASFALKVTVVVLPEFTVAAETDTKEVATERAPGLT